MSTFLRLFLVPVALGFLVAADDPPPDKKPAPQDPQSALEPRSGPGAGQKFLEKFVGDWAVVKTFHPRTGEPVRQAGECRQTMIHGGRFLQSEFTFGSGPTRTTGTGIIGFEADSGRFTSVWTDSRATRMSFRHSQDKFNGQEIVLYSQALGEGGRPERRSRTVTRLEEGGRKIVHRQWTTGPDGQERLVMELELTRKADAPGSRK
jgi:hypothetical protein